MAILDSVKRGYPKIHAAAGDFLTRLTGSNLVKDIALSAEMAGLMLWRAGSGVRPGIPAGMVVLGAVPDDAYRAVIQFITGMAASNGLNPKELDFEGISAADKKYLPELTQYEGPFREVCEKHQIESEFLPFVASASSVKLVLAGNQLKLLAAKTGLALALFHVAAGSKTMPYPVTAEKGEKA
jgi:hypothetical protein